MDILPVYLTLTMCVVYGKSNRNCTDYQQLHKENIRNSLEATTEPRGTTLDTIHPLKDLSKTDKLEESIADNFGVSRKVKMSMNMLQYLIVPGFLMAGILPWIMPGLQMVVMALSMINNMAFTSALVAIVRSYVFDKEPEEHVIYVNHGYKNKNRHR